MRDEMSDFLDGSNTLHADQSKKELKGTPGDHSLEYVATASNVLSPTTIPRDSNLSARNREARCWGNCYQPKLQDADGRLKFRRLCDDLDAEVRRLNDYVVDGELADEACGLAAEIQNLLEHLYDCPFGEGESLKSVVVAIQSQLNNAHWTASHIAFLQDVTHYLRSQWIINDEKVREIGDSIEEHGLDVFRGTVSDSGVLAKYRIEKINCE